MPVLSWWAIIAVLTRAATTHHRCCRSSWSASGCNIQGLATIGEIVTFMSFAGLLISRLEQAVGFANRVLHGRAAAAASSSTCSTPCRRCATGPDAIDPGRVRGLVEFNDVSFSYDGKRAGGRRPQLHGAAGRDHRAGRPDRRRQVDRARAAAPRVRSAVRLDQDRRHGHPRHQARGAAPQHRRGVPGGAAVQPLDRREPARRQAGRDRRASCARRPRARRRSTSSSAIRKASTARSASAAARSPAASASASRSRARC